MFYHQYFQFQRANTLVKIQTISEKIVSTLRGGCQCSITAAYVTVPQLSCDPKELGDVIFRARVSRTTDISIANLVSILQEWVTSGTASVVVEALSFDVDAACKVVIQSVDDPICSASVVTSEISTAATLRVSEGEPSTSIQNIVWPIVGAIAGGVVLILIVIIGIQIFNQCRRTRKYEFR